MLRSLRVAAALLVVSVHAPAAEWLSYCIDRQDKAVVKQSRVFWKALKHTGKAGATVSLTVVTDKRLKSLVATCTSGLEPICTVSAGETPARNDQGDAVSPYPAAPLDHAGRWRYDISGRIHAQAHGCFYLWVER